MTIDRVDSHLEEAGTWTRAAQHIARFWAWAAARGLAEPGVDATALARAPVRYFARTCDGKLLEDDFTDEGAAFAAATYDAYRRELEAYARKRRVDAYRLPDTQPTRAHLSTWLDARLARWRARHPAAPRAPATATPRLTWRQVKALATQRTLPAVFATILADPAGDAEAQAAILEHVCVRRRAWAAALVPALCALVARELPRTARSRRPLLLGDALDALGLAQTPDALAALVALTRSRFAVPAFRGRWLDALARYRAVAAVRVLRTHTRSADPYLRIAAHIGLIRNRDRAALAALRGMFDGKDFDVVFEATRQLHLVLGTRYITTAAQLPRYLAWWDAHPGELRRRVDAQR